ncbi:DNA-directed RNA polymerase subunit omega [Isachenkonia alkalipeptolytica]|uniref:DNA-directed RNA polymerase subunit omega n=1 Tax=Isachenkonia alkalipeptolytica TaxID=2565777 RepID=A0AA43XMK9_9CLOT|nr:DNA-directed RNA polymerase subunit omega [Isachenkonia alkalipeptolytica]NBG89136.1 DNA-directed RNA polymerase subunit omega [Isachenkonia alkalipeptolytica]
MLNPSVNDLVEIVGSKYTLIVLAAKRAREINLGAIPTVDMPNSNKAVSIATQEIYEGKITYTRIKE